MADDNQDKPTEQQPAPLDLKGGQSVGSGRYLLKKFLGQGGMGIVWLAQDRNLGGEVALKFLPSQLRLDSSALDDLRQETLKSRKLTHPNIIRIHDLFALEGEDPFISMEYVDGPTLSKLRVQFPARIMEWESLADLTRQLCEALEYAHNEKVIHRDLKPANLMLDSRQHIKLADFGIARVMTDSLSRVTMRQGTSGTLVYMSPQQLDGLPSNPTDDIYSVGATLYELMTSKPPFYSGEIAHQIRYVEAPSLTQRLEELRIASHAPKLVENTVAACLKKNPSDRPQSARELGECLGLLESRPPSSKSGQRAAKAPPEPPRRWKGRPVWIALGIAAGLAVIAGTANYLWNRPRIPIVPPISGSLQVIITPSEAADAGAKWRVDDGTPQPSGRVVSGLAPGTHALAFSSVAGWAAPSNQTISITANSTNPAIGTYIQSSGSLTVTMTPAAAVAAGAAWQVDGGAFQTDGVSTNLPPGSHFISFKPLRDWTPPSSQTLSINADQKILLPVTYVTNPVPPRNTGGLAVMIGPNDAIAAGAAFQVDGGTLHFANTLTNLFPGPHTVVFQPVPGWTAPASQTPIIIVGETKTVEGLYTKVPSKPLPNPAPLTPQAGQPWTNSLGMRFAPLPGTPNLLSIWDTRVMDYRAFVASANYTKNMGWTNATYANSEANPVVFVSYEDAVSFCLWLTTNAQSKGILKTNQFYCLPSDQDWSRAVGIPPEKEKGATPKERSEDVPDVYPWGKWPPPKDTGNFQAKAKLTPVGSFPPIRGFYDLSGNVWQWCSDLFDNPPNQDRVLRGGAWDTTRPNELLSSFRSSLGPHINTRNNVGFRCLLNLGDGGTPESHLRP